MKYTQPIYLVAARRSAIGRFGGGLKSLAPADLALPVAEAIVPAALKPAINQVILGQVIQAASGMNVARQLGLRLGVPQASPAFTVNMACASGLKAIALAADAIAAGEASLVLAGGVESMSRAPYYALDLRWGKKLGDSALTDAIFTDGLTDPVLKLGMGETAERIADLLKISREEQDQFALTSHHRASAARAAFQREIVSIKTREGDIANDEHPRSDTTLEKLTQLKPSFRPTGTVTAGNASGINDGAALVLVASEAAAKQHALQPRARIVAATAVGCDPATMGLGPVGAIRKLCEETGWKLGDVDAIEINEAFAAQTLGCARQLNLDLTKLNQRGGGVALGHPIGCSGARVLVTLLHLMEDKNYKRGIASLCVGGGMGIAMAIEKTSAAA
ncbi:MAG: acetyl-CoA C-acyltransferase [Verrucomicrobia bacterium]|nr:acetyl-CoA C-acyltransferase [Verrucomicrobiota bacterium]